MLAFKVSLWYILLLHSVLLRKTVSSKIPGNIQNIILKENTTISLVHTGALQFVEIFYYFKIAVPTFSSVSEGLFFFFLLAYYSKYLK